MNPLEQLIASLTKKPAPRSGFDPDFLADEMIDPSVRADAGAGAMEGELRDRIFQAERSQPAPGMSPGVGTSPNEVNALKNLLSGVSENRTKSPLGGPTPLAQQNADYTQQNALNLGARNEGFAGNPSMSPIQERNIYKRDQEKQNQPFNIESMKQSHEVGMQGRQQQATQKLVATQMAPANTQADAMAGWYERMNNGTVDPNQVRSINRNGITFQTPQRDPSTAQFDRDLATARYNLGNRDPFADPNSTQPEVQNFWQGVRTRIGNSKLDSNSQMELLKWIQKPTWDDGSPQSFDEAFPPPMPGDPSDPGSMLMHQQELQEWNEAKRLAILIRGQV